VAPVDGVLLAGFDLMVEELTPDGEEHLVTKSVLGDPFIHAGKCCARCCQKAAFFLSPTSQKAFYIYLHVRFPNLIPLW
jgi:hypothetical protein